MVNEPSVFELLSFDCIWVEKEPYVEYVTTHIHGEIRKVPSRGFKYIVSPLKSKKYESLFENIERVHPVIEYPTTVSGSNVHAS